MARNSIQESKKEAEEIKAEEKKVESKEVTIPVNQVEYIIIDKLNVLTSLVYEGFKKQGVTFGEENKVKE